jgi:hypothetical protein
MRFDHLDDDKNNDSKKSDAVSRFGYSQASLRGAIDLTPLNFAAIVT